MVGKIIDISFAIIALIAFIVGIKKGFAKQFFGLLSGIVVFIGSVALVLLIMPPIKGIGLYGKIVNLTTGWFTNEAFLIEVGSAEDVSQALSGSAALRILVGLSSTIFGKMQQLNCTTLGSFCGTLVADAIIEFLLWLVFYISLKLIFKAIKNLANKISDLPVLKTLNRILGVLWSLAMTYLILIPGLLTVVEIVVSHFIPNMAESLISVIVSSKILSIAHKTNIIGSMIANLLGYQLLTW